MTSPWGAAVSAVRTKPQGRVSVTFTPQGWEISSCPVTWSDLKVWWWWSFGLSLVLAWIGAIPVYVFNAPEVVGMVFAAPGALLLFSMLFYGVVSLIIEVVGTILAFFGLFTRKGRRRLFGSAPLRTPARVDATGVPMLVTPRILPAHAVTGARVSHHWRRVVITVRMVDGVEFRYSRFGMRRARRALEANFLAVLGPRLQTQ